LGGSHYSVSICAIGVTDDDVLGVSNGPASWGASGYLKAAEIRSR
jgi:hypothetical protein